MEQEIFDRAYVCVRDFHRLSAVDRNVLRVAAYEILHCPDVPPAVAINEAIEIAKKFSTGDSGKFVNGVLDKLAAKLRPAEIKARRAGGGKAAA